jgi:hypothetical protein
MELAGNKAFVSVSCYYLTQYQYSVVYSAVQSLLVSGTVYILQTTGKKSKKGITIFIKNINKLLRPKFKWISFLIFS